MRYICDIECDGFNPTLIWCIVCKNLDTGEVHTWALDEVVEFPEWAEANVTQYWGHNFLCFDAVHLRHLLHMNIDNAKVMDTLVLSRLFQPMIGTKLSKDYTAGQRNHSLGAWGERLGCTKDTFDQFDEWSPAMLTYCIQDVEINSKLAHFLLRVGAKYSPESVIMEHQFALVADEQQRNGFLLNRREAEILYARISGEINTLTEELQTAFPPRRVVKAIRTPQLTKDGTRIAHPDWYPEGENSIPGVPVEIVEMVPFNPGSHQQKVALLEGHWAPRMKTKGGAWSVCEENLNTLFDTAPPQLKMLAKWQVLRTRVSLLESWFKALGDDDRIHGRLIPCGTWTYRCKHMEPQTGNIVSVRSYLGKELRDLWVVDEGNVLVGTDASGIQTRILAHYINDPQYTNIIVNSDIHEHNKELMAPYCKTRDDAKTFIYSWVLGSGLALKAAQLGCTESQAAEAERRMLDSTPGLDELLAIKKAAAKVGWMRGVDGRVLYLPSNHLSLAAMLQEGEATVMKIANLYWQRWLNERGIWYKQVAFVHDEWQTETRPEHGEEVGLLQIKSIVDAGRLLGLNCPLDGETKVGLTWAGTH